MEIVSLLMTCEISKEALVVIKELIPQNRQNRYKLQNNPNFTLLLVKSICKGAETLKFIWGKKQSELLLEF